MNPYQSIYKGVEFYETPYDSNEKFSVFITREKDYVEKLIEKDQQRKKTQSSSIHNTKEVPAGTYSNWDLKPLQTKLNQDDERRPQSQQQNPSNNYGLGTGDSYGLGQESANNFNESGQKLNANQGTGGAKLPKIGRNQRKLKFSESRSPPKTSQQLTRKRHENPMTSSSNSDVDKLRSSLYFDERTKTIPKTTLKNNIIEDIVRKGDTIVGNKELLESIYKLKNLNLLKSYNTQVQRYKGIGKLAFVYNDYHTKATNPGYSRSKLGTFYTR